MKIYGWKEIDKNTLEVDIGKVIVDKEDIRKIIDLYYDIRISRYDKKYETIQIYQDILRKRAKNNFVIDHINNNPLDNRKSNLRFITRKQNAINRKSPCDSTSKYKGVYFHTKSQKWFMSIYINKKRVMKKYDNEIEAAKEYDKLAKKTFDEYAWLNFPEPGQEKYEQKLTWEENKDGSVNIDFGKLIIDKEDLENILNKKWRINIRNSKHKTIKSFHNIILDTKNKGNVIDYINGNELDNRKCNLRECTPSENNYNSIKRSRLKTNTKYKGIWFDIRKNKWICSIKYNKKSIYIGSFDDEKYAAKMYDVFAKSLFQEYTKLNFPDEQCLDIDCEEHLLKNKRKIYSKYKGVSYEKRWNKKWRATYCNTKPRKSLGYYMTEIEAAQAYDDYLIKIGKEPINFPITKIESKK